ncbi:MAG: hypothetical protein N2559_13095 [Anaerolineae bacterium]|nr:hypothetical protein [Anaerolineae bacterium]
MRRSNFAPPNLDAFAFSLLVAIALLGFWLLASLVNDVAFVSLAQPTSMPTPTSPTTRTLSESPTSTRTPTLAPAVTPTATVLPRVYLLPLRRVFAIGQAQPQSDAPFLLYEAGNDEFQMIAQQGAYVRLQTLDARINFWTTRDSVSTIPPAPAQYDYSARDKTARLASSGFACLRTEMPAPVFAMCQPLPEASSARIIAKITAGHIVFYLVEINGKQYLVPPEAIF